MRVCVYVCVCVPVSFGVCVPARISVCVHNSAHVCVPVSIGVSVCLWVTRVSFVCLFWHVKKCCLAILGGIPPAARFVHVSDMNVCVTVVLLLTVT